MRTRYGRRPEPENRRPTSEQFRLLVWMQTLVDGEPVSVFSAYQREVNREEVKRNAQPESVKSGG